MFLDNVSRTRAFTTHLAISFTVFLVMLYLITFHWYPSFFLTLDGGDRGIATIFFVDVVLGPGLTLLVFKPGKPSLKFDMSVIIILQLLAFTWGVSKVYEDRSVAAVFYLGKFNCIGATSGEEIDPDIESGKFSPQKLAFLQRPDTIQAYTDFLNEAIQSSSSEVYYYGSRFVPVDKVNVERIRTYRLDLDSVRKEDESGARLLSEYVERHPGFMQTYGLYPLSCRFGNVVAVFDFEELEVIEMLAALSERSMLRAESAIPLH